MLGMNSDIDNSEGFARFETVYNSNYDAVLRYCVRRCGDVHAAEDIVSSTFMKALTHFDTFQDRGKPVVAWLYRIAANELASYYRKKDNQNNISLDDEVLHDHVGVGHDVLEEAIQNQEALERDELYTETLRHIQEMPKKYREVILLHYVERLKVADIAIVMDCRVGTVKSLLSRGRQQLRQAMQPFGGGRVIPNVANDTIRRPIKYGEW